MNKNKIKIIGASNHSSEKREVNDFYATPDIATKALLEVENFQNSILEPACGMGHISEVLQNSGYCVQSTDLIWRGYGVGGKDFLTKKEIGSNVDIITNPPYKLAKEFVEKGMELLHARNKMALFLKIQFLEGQSRKKLFEKYPPKRIYVFSKRVSCAKDGDFEKNKNGAVAYAWFVWEKGFKGNPTVDWIN